MPNRIGGQCKKHVYKDIRFFFAKRWAKNSKIHNKKYVEYSYSFMVLEWVHLHLQQVCVQPIQLHNPVDQHCLGYQIQNKPVPHPQYQKV